jgi:hypothetical protein
MGLNARNSDPVVEFNSGSFEEKEHKNFWLAEVQRASPILSGCFFLAAGPPIPPCLIFSLLLYPSLSNKFRGRPEAGGRW